MKKPSLYAVLMLITVLGAGTASFAACTATTLTTAPGIWGIESQGSGPGGLTNYLMQVTFVSGTFTGTRVGERRWNDQRPHNDFRHVGYGDAGI